MKDTISNYDLLLIRHCKKNNPSLIILRKIIARRCALRLEHVDVATVIHFLMEIIVDYNLIRNWPEFVITDLNPKHWYTNEEKPYMVNLLEQLISKIKSAQVNKFPRYPNPAWFKNK